MLDLESLFRLSCGMCVISSRVVFIEAEVIESIDVLEHTLFIAGILACETLDRDREPMTYAYYRDIKKGKTPGTVAAAPPSSYGAMI